MALGGSAPVMGGLLVQPGPVGRERSRGGGGCVRPPGLPGTAPVKRPGCQAPLPPPAGPGPPSLIRRLPLPSSGTESRLPLCCPAQRLRSAFERRACNLLGGGRHGTAPMHPARPWGGLPPVGHLKRWLQPSTLVAAVLHVGAVPGAGRCPSSGPAAAFGSRPPFRAESGAGAYRAALLIRRVERGGGSRDPEGQRD